MDYLGKGEMLTNRDVKHICAKILERNKLFVNMEHFWDLLFQLMGPKQHVAFICLFGRV
jgi:hypothetical protein